MEIEGLLAGTKDSHKTLNDRETKNQYPEAKYDNYAQVKEKGLVTINNEVRKIKRLYARTRMVLGFFLIKFDLMNMEDTWGFSLNHLLPPRHSKSYRVVEGVP